MGAIDDWLREHTTTGAYDPNANSLVEESVGARKRGLRCVSVCLYSKRTVPGQNDEVETISGNDCAGKTCLFETS